jgi:hypothetical protein
MFGIHWKIRLAILALPTMLTVAWSGESWADRVCETQPVGVLPISLCQVADI